MSRFQFVADHLHAFEVKWLCAVVEVARSSFYAWLAGAEGRAADRQFSAAWGDSRKLTRRPHRTTPAGLSNSLVKPPELVDAGQPSLAD